MKKDNKFLRRLQLGFSLSFIILIFSSSLAFFSIKNLTKNQGMEEQTLDVINTINDVNLNLKDKVIGIRGLVLYKDVKFANPLITSQLKTDSLLFKLKNLVSDNDFQVSNTNDLIEKFRQYDLFFSETILDIKNGKIIPLAKMEDGKEKMEAVLRQTDLMKSVEKKLLIIRKEDTNDSSSQTPILIIISSIVALIITIFFYFKIKSDYNERKELNEILEVKEAETSKSILKIEEIAKEISEGNYKTRIETEGLGILSKLSNSLNAMAISLEKSFDILNDNEWLQKGLASINQKLVGNINVNEVCEYSLSYLINYGQCETGAIYLFNDGFLNLVSTNNKTVHMKKQFAEGEGYIGQTFKNAEFRTVNNLTDDDFSIRFSAGKIKIKHLIFIPILSEEGCLGVVEIGCALPFKEVDIEFHQKSVNTIGTAIISAIARRKIQNLLEETQTQTEELQSQHSELENLNTELEAQTLKLQASEEELKVQQEELLQSNLELEERSKILEEKNELISERNKEIFQKAEELALSTKYKSEFLANMSHELRTPLNSILLLSKLNAENLEGNLTADQVESAEVIVNSGNNLLALIDEILDLSRIEAGKMSIDKAPIRIGKFVEHLKGLFAPIAKDKSIQLEINVENEIENFESDDLRLGQVLKNLISNAIKFTPKGEVTVDIFEKNNEITFEVTDTGIGIAKDKLQLIFEAFQQADGSTKRRFGGTGLGLSISREIVKLLGGKLKVQSKEGEGSKFYFTIPINNGSIFTEDVAEEAPENRMFQISQSNFLASKIPDEIEDDRLNINAEDQVLLIVEDDTVFAKILLQNARKEKYKGIVIVRGDLVLSNAIHYKPKAILLDIELPVMDGYVVIEQLKSDSRTKHIPVHMMSSHQAKKESLTRGAVDFINKPFAIEEMKSIFAKIETALNKHPKKVLIVEENTKHATALSYYLSNFNINTEIKSTILESTYALQNKDIDCVILDMGVPYESGYDTLETIRNNKGLEGLPIIVFTGKNISKVEELKIKKYADSIVVKTAHSYQRVLDEVGLFLHLVDDRPAIKDENSLKKLGILTEVIKNKKVLIADDDVRNIFSLSKTLEKYQMQIVSAIDGKQALEKLDENPDTDIILMDIMMPEMDGYEAISAIRANPKFKYLPIIAVTAKAMMGDREKCIKVGASDYISKPVDTDQLLSLLRVWLYKA
jgi:signal transduction histidine kinase/DNA-binding response OmpR family regulator/CHASE3 domain sensor protein/HAMP domain-containing protein